MTFNTNTWTPQELPDPSPEPRNGFGTFFHPPSGRMIVYGGLTEDDGLLVEDTIWSYDYHLNSWEAFTPKNSPGKRAHFPMAYVPFTNEAIIFGGELVSKTADEISNDAWIFDPEGNEWKVVIKP